MSLFNFQKYQNRLAEQKLKDARESQEKTRQHRSKMNDAARVAKYKQRVASFVKNQMVTELPIIQNDEYTNFNFSKIQKRSVQLNDDQLFFNH